MSETSPGFLLLCVTCRAQSYSLSATHLQYVCVCVCLSTHNTWNSLCSWGLNSWLIIFLMRKGPQHTRRLSEKQPTSVYLCANERQSENEMRLSVFITSASVCALCERVLVVSGQGPSLCDLSQHAPPFAQPLIASLNKPSAITPGSTTITVHITTCVFC